MTSRRDTGTADTEAAIGANKPELVSIDVEGVAGDMFIGSPRTIRVNVTNTARIISLTDDDFCDARPQQDDGSQNAYSLDVIVEITEAPTDDLILEAGEFNLLRRIAPIGGGGGGPPSITKNLCVPGSGGTRQAAFTLPAQGESGYVRGNIIVEGEVTGTVVARQSFAIRVVEEERSGTPDDGDGDGAGDGGDTGDGGGGGGGDDGDGGGDGGDNGDGPESIGAWWGSLSDGEKLAVAGGGAAALAILTQRGGGSGGGRRR